MGEKMNILLVAHEKNLGGASKSLTTLAIELCKRGHKVIVVTPFRTGQLYKKLIELNIPVYKVFFGWWMMPSYWNIFLKMAFRILYFVEKIAIVKIAHIARKENIDIIHSNSSVIDIGARVAKKLGIPHVWHFREFGDADYQLQFLKGKTRSCQFVRESGSSVIFISNNLREYYKSEIPDNMCHVIYNGISEEFLNEKKLMREGSKTIFLISGNLHRNKKQDVALKAAKVLLDKGINKFELWVAGQVASTSDSKKFEKELKDFANSEIQGCCNFLGFVSDMKALREKADVELICSNREAFGRVTIEAMMAENPVIGSNTGANPELIEDKKNGRLFENGNAEDLAEKMQWFIENPLNIRECGKRAYTFAKENFLSCVNTSNIVSVYNELLDIRKNE